MNISLFFQILFFNPQICRDECEILEYDLCQRELAIARTQPMIHHQLVLPDCHELPVISTTASYNCVRLGMPSVSGQQLIKPHSCYKEDGHDYRYDPSDEEKVKPTYLDFSVSLFLPFQGHCECD